MQNRAYAHNFLYTKTDKKQTIRKQYTNKATAAKTTSIQQIIHPVTHC